MASVPVPLVLDRLADAGSRGLSLEETAADASDLELCRTWGFRLNVEEGRIVLPFDRDRLVPRWIADETPSIAWERLRVAGFFETGSTNEEATAAAIRGEPEGWLVYAEKQISGRGRKGRRWVSRPGLGLYFSLLVRPRRPLDRWVLLTQVASVALVRSLKSLSEEGWTARKLEVDLKWPNDVLLSGKKTAGILIETAGAGPKPEGAVVGVGINMGKGSVPEELSGLATSVGVEAGGEVPRRLLLVRFLYFFQLGYGLLEGGEDSAILDQWKSLSSMWDGVAVWIVQEGDARPAVTCGLTDTGALRIRRPDGVEETVVAADVSLRRR